MKNSQSTPPCRGLRLLGAPAWMALALGLAPACSSGGGGGSGDTPDAESGGVDLVLQGIPTSGLSSFEGRISEVRLVDEGGIRTENLLDGPRRIELQGLADAGLLLDAEELPAGTYTAVELEFDPSSMAARRADGSDVAVDTPATMLSAPLMPPVVVTGGTQAELRISVDLPDGVDDPGGPSLTFTPVGAVDELGDPLPLEPLYGLVTEVDAGAETFVVRAFADAAAEHPLGALEVELVDAARLFDLTGVEFADPGDFFGALAPDLTFLRLNGSLDGDRLSVVRAFVVDQAGGGVVEVIVRGSVLAVDDVAQVLTLRLQHVLAGETLADQVLAGLDDPTTFDCAWDGTTRFWRGGTASASSDDLAVGQTVTLVFARFDAEPFSLAEVDLGEGGRRVTGTVVEDADAPFTIQIELTEDDAGVLAGDDPLGRVLTLDLADAEASLIFTGKPAVPLENLVEGMKIHADGARAGDVVVTEHVDQHPGHLIKGEVTAIDRNAGTLTLGSSQIVQTFGDRVDEGTTVVELHPSCRYLQEAGDADGLFDLFEGLDEGDFLDLKVKGVGERTPGRLVAYEIKAKTRRGNDR